jgi:hypothetical protein
VGAPTRTLSGIGASEEPQPLGSRDHGRNTTLARLHSPAYGHGGRMRMGLDRGAPIGDAAHASRIDLTVAGSESSTSVPEPIAPVSIDTRNPAPTKTIRPNAPARSRTWIYPLRRTTGNIAESPVITRRGNVFRPFSVACDTRRYGRIRLGLGRDLGLLPKPAVAHGQAASYLRRREAQVELDL